MCLIKLIVATYRLKLADGHSEPECALPRSARGFIGFEHRRRARVPADMLSLGHRSVDHRVFQLAARHRLDRLSFKISSVPPKFLGDVDWTSRLRIPSESPSDGFFRASFRRVQGHRADPGSVVAGNGDRIVFA
jgi:hypothetical protein